MPAIRSQRGEYRGPCHTFQRPISGKIEIGFPDEKFKDRVARQNRCLAVTKCTRACGPEPCQPPCMIPARASDIFSRWPTRIPVGSLKNSRSTCTGISGKSACSTGLIHPDGSRKGPGIREFALLIPVGPFFPAGDRFDLTAHTTISCKNQNLWTRDARWWESGPFSPPCWLFGECCCDRPSWRR